MLIKDEILAGILAEEITGDASKVEALTKENLATIKEIYSVVILVERDEDKKIQSIEGLEHCVNLKQLHLVDHLIRDLSPIKNLDKLEIINLRRNRIPDIAAMENKKTCVELVIAHNRVKNLTPLKELTGIERLYIQENPIESLPTDFLTGMNLEAFSCWNTNNEIVEAAKKMTGVSVYYDNPRKQIG